MSRTEILEVGGPSPVWLWWSRLPRAWRRALVAALVVVSVVVAGTVAVLDLRERRAERARVAVTLRLDVGADSSTPPGGAVWFSVLLRNDADLPVRIDDLTAKGAGLELSVAEPSQGRRPAVPRTLDPGGQARVLMSVRLFCADRRAARSQPGGTVVTGALQVTPADGRRREIIDVLSGSGPVTDAADTVCRYQDRATGVELSGPVLRR